MKLNDKIDFVGHFTLKMFKADGSIDTYEEKNLIMDTARSNMANLVGGWDVAMPINRLVLGTDGHVGTNILDFKKVGENGFETIRTQTFSEELGNFNYQLPFDPNSSSNVKTVDADGFVEAAPLVTTTCEVQRTITDRVVTYVFTIPDTAANQDSGIGFAVAYTEAALYAGNKIFSLKTFPARVKEDTVRFEITWSIIF